MTRRPYTAEQLLEIDNLVAAAALDPAAGRALMAELVALRQLHQVALHRRARLRIELDRLPQNPGDVGAWKAQLARSGERAPGEDLEETLDLIGAAR